MAPAPVSTGAGASLSGCAIDGRLWRTAPAASRPTPSGTTGSRARPAPCAGCLSRYGCVMATKVPMLRFRRSPGEWCDRARLRDEVVELMRDGRPVAVLLSPERYARMRALERAEDAGAD